MIESIFKYFFHHFVINISVDFVKEIESQLSGKGGFSSSMRSSPIFQNKTGDPVKFVGIGRDEYQLLIERNPSQ